MTDEDEMGEKKQGNTQTNQPVGTRMKSRTEVCYKRTHREC